MSADDQAIAEELVRNHVAHLLERIDIPGLYEATIDLTARALSASGNDLMHTQLRQLLGTSGRRLPDAYLAAEAAPHDSLEQAAAGLRAALAQVGDLVDAHGFERQLAEFLADDEQLSIRAELARVPRPDVRPDPLRWSLDPAPWASEDRSNDAPWPPEGFDIVAGLRTLPDGVDALARVDNGPHAGWTQIGLAERHHTPARRYPALPQRTVLIMFGLEITDTAPPARSLPYTEGPWQLWTEPWQRMDIPMIPDLFATESFPVLALTDGGRCGPRHRRNNGPGLPEFLLAPAPEFIAALDLHPTRGTFSGFSLSDDNGPGLVGRQWRGHLVHDGNYKPLTPAVEGCDLLIRPDLLAKVTDLAAADRMHVGIQVAHSET
ncbi:hypothetical protein [Rhodococcus opacus]|uniref:Uncharacterized protein n=1 Tax=Rhodococcus opacus TaxID=37919 RepID=A0A2S8IGV6_RHOOP|nr:hypothetical protein [Rhodococcus opacus]PQP14016.1 hypothetical protein C5613_41525 [Rhodococcus opacus]